jgi:hypothetical protein
VGATASDQGYYLVTAAMYRIPVQSDAIRSIGYDGQSILEIEFEDGAVYRYHGVPPDVHDAFMYADSKGKFFQQYLRDQYETHWVPG